MKLLKKFFRATAMMCLLSFICVTCFLTGKTLAKYTEHISSSSGARAAEFDIEIELPEGLSGNGESSEIYLYSANASKDFIINVRNNGEVTTRCTVRFEGDSGSQPQVSADTESFILSQGESRQVKLTVRGDAGAIVESIRNVDLIFYTEQVE